MQIWQLAMYSYGDDLMTIKYFQLPYKHVRWHFK